MFVFVILYGKRALDILASCPSHYNKVFIDCNSTKCENKSVLFNEIYTISKNMKNLVKCRFRKFYFMLLAVSFLSCFVIFYLSKFTLDKLLEIQENGKSQRFRNKYRIPQIIGHYMGPGVSLNLSQDFLNTNNYDENLVHVEGDDGQPVVIPSKDLLIMQQLFQINRFNLLASDRMSVNRSLQDVRNNV